MAEVDRPDQRTDAGTAATGPCRAQGLPRSTIWSLQAEPACWPALHRSIGLPAPPSPSAGAWQAAGHEGRWLQLGPWEAWLCVEGGSSRHAAGDGAADAQASAGMPHALGAAVAAQRARGAALACVDIGDAWVGWHLRGAGLTEVLAHGCTLDFERFGRTGCARTRLAQAPVVIAPDLTPKLTRDPTSDRVTDTATDPATELLAPAATAGGGLTLWTERSHATYVARWLAATGVAVDHAPPSPRDPSWP